MIASLHRRLRTAADRAARATGILARRERESLRELTVLMYHRVLPDEGCRDYPLPSLAMPLSAFREQVRWLAERGDVLPLSEALGRHRVERGRKRPLFAITIDDGYDDGAHFAAPAIEEVGARATFFVTTGFVGTRGLLWFDRAVQLFARVPSRTRRQILLGIPGAPRELADAAASAQAGRWIGFLKRSRPADRAEILARLEGAAEGAPHADGFRALSVDELRGLDARGHEIGSHSITHPLLPELDDASLDRELRDSRARLDDYLGRPVEGFCYPNGDCDARVVSAVARAGHGYACTTRDGTWDEGDDPFRIRRVDIVPGRVVDRAGRFDPTAFRRELCGLYRRRGRAREDRP